MGLELGKISIKRFADGEIYVQLQESVRGCNVYLIQPTSPPANENLMELQVMIDACRRASAKNITAVIPYFGYARADRKASILHFTDLQLTGVIFYNAWVYMVLHIHTQWQAGFSHSSVSRFIILLFFVLSDLC